jgi:hypothetical protein
MFSEMEDKDFDAFVEQPQVIATVLIKDLQMAMT